MMSSREKESSLTHRTPTINSSNNHKWLLWTFSVAAAACVTFLRYDVELRNFIGRPAVSSVVEHECTAPFPQFTFKHDLFNEDARIRKAAHDLNEALTARFNEGGLDSVAVAVVTAEGSVYEGFWGVQRANETDKSKQGAIDRHTVYRLASISKLFTTMETYMLRDRGIFNLYVAVKSP